MNIICEFCSRGFQNTSNLKNHKNTAKYCLKIQNVKPKMIKCENCPATFTQKIGLERHLLKCDGKKIFLLNQIHEEKLELQKQMYEEKLELQKQMYEEKLELQKEKYEERICVMEKNHCESMEYQTEFREQLHDIAIKGVQKSTVTTNNNNNNNKIYNNFQPITHQSITESADNLTPEHIENGARGYASFLIGGPLKNNILCSDYARRVIKYKREDGKIYTDPEGVSILKLIGTALDSKNRELIFKMADKLRENPNLNDEIVFKMLDKLAMNNFGIRQARDGSKSRFTMDLVKEICSLAI